MARSYAGRGLATPVDPTCLDAASVAAVRQALALLVVAACTAGCAGGEDTSEADTVTLEGPQWALVSGIDLEIEDPASAPSATFDGGGVSGRAICNSYASAYTVEGSSLHVQPVALTRIACPPPGPALEDAFFDALEGVGSWEIEDDELVLMDADGDESLRFEPAPVS
jgi:heat shock protein HslJ